MNAIEWLTAHKSYVVSAVAILSALVAYWNGTIDTGQLVAAILAALGLSAVHHDQKLELRRLVGPKNIEQQKAGKP